MQPGPYGPVPDEVGFTMLSLAGYVAFILLALYLGYRCSAKRMSIIVREQGSEHPRVFNADSGEELTSRIPIRYLGQLQHCASGETIRFAIFSHRNGRTYLAASGLATEEIRARVVSASSGKLILTAALAFQRHDAVWRHARRFRRLVK
jgi:hypothetical protein